MTRQAHPIDLDSMIAGSLPDPVTGDPMDAIFRVDVERLLGQGATVETAAPDEYEMTLDRRDLFDVVRSALVDALRSRGAGDDDGWAEVWAEASDRAERALSRLRDGLPPELEQGVPTVQATAPERMFLQVSDARVDRDEPFPDDIEGVTWCDDSVVDCEVPYVRADLVLLQRKRRIG